MWIMSVVALFITTLLFCVCTPPILVQDSEQKDNVKLVVQDTEPNLADDTLITTPETQGHKQSVAIYMAGMEPSALKGVHKVIGSEFAKAFTASKAFSAVDRTQEVLNIIAKEHIYQRSGAVDDEQIKELGKQLGVRYLCIAEVNEVMDSYLLDARLVDVETAQVLKIASKPGTMKDIYQLVAVTQETALELIQERNR